MQARTETQPDRAERLLLVELVTDLRQRVDRAQTYPYLKGWAAEHGVETRWLCIGGTYDMEPGEGGDVIPVVSLEPDDQDRLDREVLDWSPSHVLFNEIPAKRLEQAARESAPEARFLAMQRYSDVNHVVSHYLDHAIEGGNAPGTWKRDWVYAAIDIMQRVGWFARWLGIDAGSNGPYDWGDPVADSADPLYDARMFNQAARDKEPMVRILGRVFCDYRRPARDNEVYRDVDLSDCSREHGCTFCPIRTPPIIRSGKDPLDLAEDQLRRLHPDGKRVERDSGHYDIYDIRLFRRIDEFVDMVVGLNLPPSTFCFSPRIDHLLNARRNLERALPGVAEAGHAIRLFRIGAESFSQAQQERFNKGISARQIDEALGLMQDLERRWPGSFISAQPLAFITFTPWSTLEETRTILSKGRDWGLPTRGRWLFSTLELDRGSPITALAVADGDIIVDDWEDPAQRYSTSIVGTFRKTQLAWRFREDRVAAFYGILVRVCAAMEHGFPDTVFADDPLYGVLQDRLEGRFGSVVEPLDFALELLDVIEGSDPPYDREAAMNATLERLVKSGRAGPQSRERIVWLLRDVLDRRPEAVPDTRVETIEIDAEQRFAVLMLNTAGSRYEVRLQPLGAQKNPGARSIHFCGFYENHPEIAPHALHDVVMRVLRLLDRLVPRYAPGFLGVPSDPVSPGPGTG